LQELALVKVNRMVTTFSLDQDLLGLNQARTNHKAKSLIQSNSNLWIRTLAVISNSAKMI
jgi:hypothetical protein